MAFGLIKGRKEKFKPAEKAGFFILKKEKMKLKKINKLSILYPSGNINAFVADNIPPSFRDEVSRLILLKYNKNKPKEKQIEQVCFEAKPLNNKTIARAELNGNEFSGNTALCLTFLNLKKIKKGNIEVSGSSTPLRASFLTSDLVSSQMPKIGLDCFSKTKEGFSLIELKGIDQIVVPKFFNIKESKQKQTAKNIIKNNKLKKDKAIGILFTKKVKAGFKMIPYIYFKKSVNWQLYKETSCGSGTVAVGVEKFLSQKRAVKNLKVIQPSGQKLLITVKKRGNELLPILKGQVKLIYQGSFSLV